MPVNIAEIAVQPVVTVDVTDRCEKAVMLMQQHDLRHLPVLDELIPVGMVSERDLLFHLYWLGSEGGVEMVHPYVATEATQVGEIVSTPLISISPLTTLQEGARLLLDNEISALPLVREQRLEGLVTETDMLRCFAQAESLEISPDWRQRRVEEYMVDLLITVEPTKPNVMALRLMGEQHIRHVPVLDGDNEVVGIISDRDIFRGCAKEAEEERNVLLGERFRRNQVNLVEDVMTRQLEMVHPSSTLAEAAQRMAAKRVGALLVMDGSQLVGLLSETDLLEVIVAACEESS